MGEIKIKSGDFSKLQKCAQLLKWNMVRSFQLVEFHYFFPSPPYPMAGALLLCVYWDKFQFFHLRLRRSNGPNSRPGKKKIEFYVPNYVQPLGENTTRETHFLIVLYKKNSCWGTLQGFNFEEIFIFLFQAYFALLGKCNNINLKCLLGFLANSYLRSWFYQQLRWNVMLFSCWPDADVE